MLKIYIQDVRHNGACSRIRLLKYNFRSPSNTRSLYPTIHCTFNYPYKAIYSYLMERTLRSLQMRYCHFFHLSYLLCASSKKQFQPTDISVGDSHAMTPKFPWHTVDGSEISAWEENCSEKRETMRQVSMFTCSHVVSIKRQETFLFLFLFSSQFFFYLPLDGFLQLYGGWGWGTVCDSRKNSFQVRSPTI